MKPQRIELDRSVELRITWEDGGLSRILIDVLRRNCPCASCREARLAEEPRQGRPLPVVGGGGHADGAMIADGAELVGNYGLRVFWRDGHSAGIYDYARLREMNDSGGKSTACGCCERTS